MRGCWEGADILWLHFDAPCHVECLCARTPWGSGGGGGEHASARQRMPLVMPPPPPTARRRDKTLFEPSRDGSPEGWGALLTSQTRLSTRKPRRRARQVFMFFSRLTFKGGGGRHDGCVAPSLPDHVCDELFTYVG